MHTDMGIMDEAVRQATLEALDVLDTPDEPEFDAIVDVVQRVLDVPIALVSLVDADRQWFKACLGLDVRETPRDVAFCARAILSDDLLIVPDTHADPHFAANPLVTGAPHIRSYAGAPLIASNGARLGTLCAIELRPREHTETALATLRSLARVVVGLLVERWLARSNQPSAQLPLSPRRLMRGRPQNALPDRQT